MSWPWRIALAALCWAAALAAGWWWPASAERRGAKPLALVETRAAAAPRATPPPAELASQVAAADPMGLTWAKPEAPGATAAAASAAEGLEWRLAALVVRDTERYAVLTASGQTPLRLRAGEKLPNGDRIRAIYPNRIEIQSPRGRPRTLYLTEP